MPISYFVPVQPNETAFTFTAETDVDVTAGQVVRVQANTHLILAQADSLVGADATGIVITDAGSGFAAKFATAGQLTLTDWTAITGSALLTPGTTYFLDPDSPGVLTSIPPALPGQVVIALGEALSTVTFSISLGSPILL
jgi:hypothetical protein